RGNFAALGVPDAHEGVAPDRALNRDHLIAADAGLPVGDRARLRWRKLKPAMGAGIENDKVIPGPIHFKIAHRSTVTGKISKLAALCEGQTRLTQPRQWAPNAPPTRAWRIQRAIYPSAGSC